MQRSICAAKIPSSEWRCWVVHDRGGQSHTMALVRFASESGHARLVSTCRLRAISALVHCSKIGGYSIISSACSRDDSGMVKPSAFAVVRLMTRSVFSPGRGVTETSAGSVSAPLFDGNELRPVLHLHARNKPILAILGLENRCFAFLHIEPVLAQGIDDVWFVRDEIKCFCLFRASAPASCEAPQLAGYFRRVTRRDRPPSGRQSFRCL